MKDTSRYTSKRKDNRRISDLVVPKAFGGKMFRGTTKGMLGI